MWSTTVETLVWTRRARHDDGEEIQEMRQCGGHVLPGVHRVSLLMASH